MVNNSTNINKTNNHLSPQIIKNKKDYDIYMGLKIQVLVWDNRKHCGGVRLDNGIPTPTF